jgi:hypothetical protein
MLKFFNKDLTKIINLSMHVMKVSIMHNLQNKKIYELGTSEFMNFIP